MPAMCSMHFLRALVHSAFVPSVESAVPAGPPESGAVQEILHWQANTVGMMYSLIADAIKAKGALSTAAWRGDRRSPIRVQLLCNLYDLDATSTCSLTHLKFPGQTRRRCPRLRCCAVATAGLLGLRPRDLQELRRH